MVRVFVAAQYLPPKPDPVVRFETAPGAQMQVDWATVRRGHNRLSMFVAMLGWSRAAYVEFVTDELWPRGLWPAMSMPSWRLAPLCPGSTGSLEAVNLIDSRGEGGRRLDAYAQDAHQLLTGYRLPRKVRPAVAPGPWSVQERHLLRQAAPSPRRAISECREPLQPWSQSPCPGSTLAPKVMQSPRIVLSMLTRISTSRARAAIIERTPWAAADFTCTSL